MRLEVNVTCPHCRGRFKEFLGKMRAGRVRSCPACGGRIRFTNDDGARAQRAVDDFERALKEFPKKLELNI